MITLPTVPASWYAVAALVITNALTFGLWRHSTDEFTTYRASVVAVGRVQQEHTDSVNAQQKQLLEDTTNGWKAALDYLRANPIRVRTQPGAGAMPGISAPASGADETGGYPISSAAELATQCAETTLELNKLQEFEERKGRIK